MTTETAQIYGLETLGDVRPRNQCVLQAIRHHLAESLQVMADCSEDDDAQETSCNTSYPPVRSRHFASISSLWGKLCTRQNRTNHGSSICMIFLPAKPFGKRSPTLIPIGLKVQATFCRLPLRNATRNSSCTLDNFASQSSACLPHHQYEL